MLIKNDGLIKFMIKTDSPVANINLKMFSTTYRARNSYDWTWYLDCPIFAV